MARKQRARKTHPAPILRLPEKTVNPGKGMGRKGAGTWADWTGDDQRPGGLVELTPERAGVFGGGFEKALFLIQAQRLSVNEQRIPGVNPAVYICVSRARDRRRIRVAVLGTADCHR